MHPMQHQCKNKHIKNYLKILVLEITHKYNYLILVRLFLHGYFISIWTKLKSLRSLKNALKCILSYMLEILFFYKWILCQRLSVKNNKLP